MIKISPNILYYLNFLNKRRELCMWIALGVMTLAVAVSYLLPKSYESSSTIFIEQNVITDLVKGIAVTQSMQAKIKNITVALTSKNLLTKVLKELNVDTKFTNDSDMESYILLLQKRIQITLKEKQGVLVVAFRDPDPRFARDFVNTLCRVFIEENTSNKRDESLEAFTFLGEQLKVFKERLDAADEAINKFKGEQGLNLAADETFIRTEINNAEKRLEELSLRKNELQAKLDIYKREHRSASRGVSGEDEVRRLQKIYTDKHPKVIAAKIRATHPRASSSQASARFDNDEEIQLAQVELDSIKSMEQRQLRIIEDNTNLLKSIPQLKATLADLMRRRENEAHIYNQLVSRYGQSEISKQMELKNKSVTFRIIDPAELSARPVSPNRAGIIFAGIFLGLATGIGSVLLIGHLRGLIKSVSDVRNLGVPVFAVIPTFANDCLNQRQNSPRSRWLMTAGASYFMFIVLIGLFEAFKRPGTTDSLIKSFRNIFS